MARSNVGIYRPETLGTISGGLNRFASPWAQQGSCNPALYECYRTFVDDNGDGTAAGRRPGRLNVPDPSGFLYGVRGRRRK